MYRENWINFYDNNDLKCVFCSCTNDFTQIRRDIRAVVTFARTIFQIERTDRIYANLKTRYRSRGKWCVKRVDRKCNIRHLGFAISKMRKMHENRNSGDQRYSMKGSSPKFFFVFFYYYFRGYSLVRECIEQETRWRKSLGWFMLSTIPSRAATDIDREINDVLPV